MQGSLKTRVSEGIQGLEKRVTQWVYKGMGLGSSFNWSQLCALNPVPLALRITRKSSSNSRLVEYILIYSTFEY